MGAEAAATVAGKTPENFSIVCENFDKIVAQNMAQNGMIKGISSQRPRDQAIAEARLGAAALLGIDEDMPNGWLIPTVPATRDNLAEAYETVYHEPLPERISKFLDQ
jgi:ribose transport system substrate-binding protein